MENIHLFEYLFDFKTFNCGQEDQLLKEFGPVLGKDIDIKSKFDMHMTIAICTSSIRLMGKITEEVYSKKVCVGMQDFCTQFREYISGDEYKKLLSKMDEKGINSKDHSLDFLLLKILVNFMILPKTNLLVDCDNLFLIETNINNVYPPFVDKIPDNNESYKVMLEFQELLSHNLQKNRKKWCVGFFEDVVLPSSLKYCRAYISFVDYKNKPYVVQILHNLKELTSNWNKIHTYFLQTFGAHISDSNSNEKQ